MDPVTWCCLWGSPHWLQRGWPLVIKMLVSISATLPYRILRLECGVGVKRSSRAMRIWMTNNNASAPPRERGQRRHIWKRDWWFEDIWSFDSTSLWARSQILCEKCLDSLVYLSRNVPLALRFKQGSKAFATARLYPRPKVARLIRESRGEGPLGCRLHESWLSGDLGDWLHSRPRQSYEWWNAMEYQYQFLKPSDWRGRFYFPTRMVSFFLISPYLEMASDLIWRMLFKSHHGIQPAVSLFCIPFQGPGCRSMVSVCCCCLEWFLILGEAQVLNSNRALQPSTEAVINVCFELLGVSGFFFNLGKMFRESPRGGHSFGAILRGQIGCCWISDEMVGRCFFL